jgi:hypothetical protein
MIGQRKRCEQFLRREEGLRANTDCHLFDWRPTSNATVLLDLLLCRMIDDALNPLNSNHSAIGPNTHCLKVLSGFHCGAQKGVDATPAARRPLREKRSRRTR